MNAERKHQQLEGTRLPDTESNDGGWSSNSAAAARSRRRLRVENIKCLLRTSSKGLGLFRVFGNGVLRTELSDGGVNQKLQLLSITGAPRHEKLLHFQMNPFSLPFPA